MDLLHRTPTSSASTQPTSQRLITRQIPDSAIELNAFSSQAQLLASLEHTLLRHPVGARTPVFLSLGVTSFLSRRSSAGAIREQAAHWIIVDSASGSAHSPLLRAAAALGAVIVSSLEQAVALASTLSTLPIIEAGPLLTDGSNPAHVALLSSALPNAWRLVTDDALALRLGCQVSLQLWGCPAEGACYQPITALFVDHKSLSSRLSNGQLYLDLQTLRVTLGALNQAAERLRSDILTSDITTFLRPKRLETIHVRAHEDLLLASIPMGWPIELKRSDHPAAWLARDSFELEEAAELLSQEPDLSTPWSWQLRRAPQCDSKVEVFHFTHELTGGVWVHHAASDAACVLPLSRTATASLPRAAALILRQLSHAVSLEAGTSLGVRCWVEGNTIWWDERAS